MVLGDDLIYRNCLEKMVGLAEAHPAVGMVGAYAQEGERIFYSESNIHADTEVSFALLKSNDFGFVHEVLTFSRVRQASLSTVSKGLHTYFGGTLQVLLGYGPEYLTKEEYERLLSEHLADYYRFLGKSLIQRREPKFWEYHKRQLEQAGLGFSRLRVVTGAVAALRRAAVKKLWKGRMTDRLDDSRSRLGEPVTKDC
jgi:hypothetical protein